MKTVIKSFLIVIAVVYLSTSFVKMSINPGTWFEGDRFGLVVICLMLGIPLSIFSYVAKENI